MALFWRIDFQQNWGFLGAIARDYLTEFLFRTIKARWHFRMEGNHSSCFIHFNKGETSFEDGSSKPLPSRKLVILVNKKTTSYGPKMWAPTFPHFQPTVFFGRKYAGSVPGLLDELFAGQIASYSTATCQYSTCWPVSQSRHATMMWRNFIPFCVGDMMIPTFKYF